MAVADRKSTSHLASVALDDAQNYAFFQLVEYIHRLNGCNLEHAQDISPRNETIKYSSSGSIGFPASDVTDAGMITYDGKSQHWIETSFFGMHGSSSPLPSHFLDVVAWEYGQKEGIRYHFLDFFNHRLTTLLHRAWRKYRYFVRFSPAGTDKFSTYCFSLMGVNDKTLRDDTSINWSLLLKFSGIIASQHRSAKSVGSIIKHYFSLESVKIKEWVQRNVEVAPDQLGNLGVANFSLGQTLVLGDKVPTRMGKFVISITKLTRKEFKDFLPNGKKYPVLIELVDFLLKNHHAYDLELGLLPEDIPQFQLSAQDERPAHLGWSTVIGSQSPDDSTLITINAKS